MSRDLARNHELYDLYLIKQRKSEKKSLQINSRFFNAEVIIKRNMVNPEQQALLVKFDFQI